MADVNISVEHTLTADEALVRIKTLLETIKRQYTHYGADVIEKWNGSKGSFRLTVMGMVAEGRITVSNDHVVFEATLPATAKPCSFQIERIIRLEAEKVLRS